MSLGTLARFRASLSSKILLNSPDDLNLLTAMIRKRVPEWDMDEDLWAFEAPREMPLFNETSNGLVYYEKGSLVVMRDLFPITAFAPTIDLRPVDQQPSH